jgi:Transposase IS116/IS110/IS902 family
MPTAGSPDRLARVAKTSLRRKSAELQLALEGSVNMHQRALLRRQLRHVEFLEQEIQELTAIDLIDGTWGLGRRSAEAILAETSIDMSRSPVHNHITSWAKICPGNNESAGKRRSGWTGSGNPWLRTSLVEAASGVSRRPDSYFGPLYRLRPRGGGESGPSSPSPAPSWSLSTTCSKMEPSTRISARSISTVSMARLSFAAGSAAWKGSATEVTVERLLGIVPCLCGP